MKTKICPRCKIEKNLDAFAYASREKSKTQSWCKKCGRIVNANNRWRRRGIKCDTILYNSMFAKQQGCCAVCGKHQSELNKAFDVDHNHETGQVRGLLCGQCNRGLGNFYVDSNGVELLLKAKEYMDNVYP